MEKYVYIKKNVNKDFIDFIEPLSDSEYNNIGETWEDYVNNLWVLLSDEQVEFLQQNPSASVEEVWKMEMYHPEPVIRSLEMAKDQKISEIDVYDNSDDVNLFYINNIPMWLFVEERQQIATQISANEAAGRENMTKWYNGTEFTFSLTSWKQMLVALEVYAGDAKNVTEYHKSTVNGLQTIEEVDNYNYKINYPEKLHFDI